jgi:DNA-binding MarR family transcriptional regulator
MAIAQISEMEFKVLLTINRLQAMLFSDIVEAFFESDIKHGYKVIEDLTDKNLIITRIDRRDNRRKYAVLATKGIKLLNHIGAPNTPSEPVRAHQACQLLGNSEIYMALIKAGIKGKDILSRRDALAHLDMHPTQTPIVWLAKIRDTYHAFYQRIPKRRTWLVHGILEADAKTNLIPPASHAVVYPPETDRSRDRRWFVNNITLPKNVHCLRLKEVCIHVTNLHNPLGYAYDMQAALDILAPGGEVYPLDNAPFDYAWDKTGSPLLLGDLTSGNISHAQKAKTLLPNHFERWAKGILFLVATSSEAKLWARLVDYRPWVWFLTQDSLQGPALYRSLNGKIKRFRTVSTEQIIESEVI